MKILRYLVGLFVLGLCVGAASAQTTSVTMTVVDPTSQVWANGFISYQFRPAPGVPGPYQWQGAALPSSYLVPTYANLNSSGAVTVSIPDNTTITPALSQWTFVVCSNTSFQCATINTPVSGSSENISSIINAQLIPINLAATTVPRAYSSTEITIVPQQGALYYDVTAGCLKSYSGSVWSCLGSGSSALTNQVTGQVPVANSPTTANSSVAAGITLDNVFCPLGVINCSLTPIVAASSTNQTIVQTNSSFGVNVNDNSTSAVYSTFSAYLQSILTGAGYYNNSGPWGSGSGLGLNFMTNSPSIAQGISASFTCEKVGDCMAQYWYNLIYGGCYFGSDECQPQDVRHNEQIGYMQGNITTPLVGDTSTLNGNTQSGYTYLYYYPLGSVPGPQLFNGGGTIASFSARSSLTLTAQTGYIVIFTPGTTSTTATINQVIPVTVAAASGVQTWTPANFGTITVSVGQGIGFYLGTGNGLAGRGAGNSCSTTAGIPTVGSITVATGSGCNFGSGQNVLVAITASLTPIGTGSTVFAIAGGACYSHSQGCEGQAQGGFAWTPKSIVLDIQNTPVTATATSTSNVQGDNLTYNISGYSGGISTAWGTTSSCTGPTTNNNSLVAQSFTCNVTLGTSPASPGSFSTSASSGFACIAGPYTDQVQITAAPAAVGGVQSVTFLSYGSSWNSSLIMQGTGCGTYMVSSASIVGGNYYWPVAYPVIGFFSTTQVATANCIEGGCLGGSSSNTISTQTYSGGATLTRTSNVVTATSPELEVQFFGGTIVVTGCTVDPTLNGTYTGVTNNANNVTPLLSWSDAGSNSSDSTCNIANPSPGVSFYPGSYVVYSPNLQGLQTEPNNTVWAPGDVIIDAPTSELGLSDMQIYHGQSTNSSISGGFNYEDDGPIPVPQVWNIINTSGYGNILPISASQVFNIVGNYLKYLNITYRPAYSGCIICVTGNEPLSETPVPYFLFQDHYASLSIAIDPVHNTINTSPINANWQIGEQPSSFAAGSTVNNHAICTVDGINCPAALVASCSGTGFFGYYVTTTQIACSPFLTLSGNNIYNYNGYFRSGGPGTTGGFYGTVGGTNYQLYADGTNSYLQFNGGNFVWLTGNPNLPTSYFGISNMEFNSGSSVTAVGGITVSQMSAPSSGPQLTITGTTGSTTYSYVCTNVDSNGKETTVSPTTTNTAGNATLSGSNYINVKCYSGLTNGAVTQNVYRTVGGATQGYIGNVATASVGLNDTGIVATHAAPTLNNTGSLGYGGPLVGPSARKGTFTCTAGGTITITNSYVLATSDIPITLNTAGGTITTTPVFKTNTPGTGFTIGCGATDTSVYNYNVLN